MRKDLWKRRFCLTLTAALVLLAAGCGQKGLTVEGNVTWDGKPAESGVISFAPADGKGPSVGTEIKGGKYRLAGESATTPGKKTVSISAVRKTGKQVEAGPPAPPGTMVDEQDNVSSTQTCEVVEGKVNQHDFEVKSAAK